MLIAFAPVATVEDALWMVEVPVSILSSEYFLFIGIVFGEIVESGLISQYELAQY